MPAERRQRYDSAATADNEVDSAARIIEKRQSQEMSGKLLNKYTYPNLTHS